MTRGKRRISSQKKVGLQQKICIPCYIIEVVGSCAASDASPYLPRVVGAAVVRPEHQGRRHGTASRRWRHKGTVVGAADPKRA
jgi:hypothetical protein